VQEPCAPEPACAHCRHRGDDRRHEEQLDDHARSALRRRGHVRG
jgi:hypothetical protein